VLISKVKDLSINLKIDQNRFTETILMKQQISKTC